MSAGADWIARLSLAPHPEGGWFRRIHTDPRVVHTPHGPRAALTSIHYLLTRDQPLGCLHRNRSDILHYLQDGGPVEYLLLSSDGALERVVLGPAADQQLFLFVPGGIWKGSRLIGGASHALVSEVVTPGFSDADHCFARRDLLDRHPEHARMLEAFLRPG